MTLNCVSSFLLFLFVECLHHETVLNFIRCLFLNQMLFLHQLRQSYVFLSSVDVVYLPSYVEPILHPRNKPHVVGMYNPFTILLNSVC